LASHGERGTGVGSQGHRDHGLLSGELRGCDSARDRQGSETVRDIRGAWVKEQMVRVENGNIAEYRVDLKVTFVLE
jgi:hypothetical protein